MCNIVQSARKMLTPEGDIKTISIQDGLSSFHVYIYAHIRLYSEIDIDKIYAVHYDT